MLDMRRHISLIIVIASILSGCAMQLSDRAARLDGYLIISVADQRMAYFINGVIQESFPISTSKTGVGEELDSDTTPRGLHEIVEKIGEDAPVGMVFESRIPTGEIVEINSPGRWPVVTRILRLGGLESRNKNTFDRLIYIHGSPVEHMLGSPASGGCIRMKSEHIVPLFKRVKIGTKVEIREEPMPIVTTAARMAHARDLNP